MTLTQEAKTMLFTVVNVFLGLLVILGLFGFPGLVFVCLIFVCAALLVGIIATVQEFF